MAEAEVITLVLQDKCRNCGHTWPMKNGILQIRCPECKSFNISRPNPKNLPKLTEKK